MLLISTQYRISIRERIFRERRRYNTAKKKKKLEISYRNVGTRYALASNSIPSSISKYYNEGGFSILQLNIKFKR